MIVLLMLTQRSRMLFWALADKQMLIKMIIFILKIVMKVITIQLTMKKKKIRTNYQNEALYKTLFSCNIYYGWYIL